MSDEAAHRIDIVIHMQLDLLGRSRMMRIVLVIVYVNSQFRFIPVFNDICVNDGNRAAPRGVMDLRAANAVVSNLHAVLTDLYY